MKKNATATDRTDRMFRAFSDRTRLRILHLLQGGEMCVGDLVEVLRVPQPKASRHLAYLKKAGLVDEVLYIVTTMGVPLKVDGPGARQLSERASVDSELALLYGKLKGARYSRTGGVPNPFFMQRDAPSPPGDGAVR